MRLRHAAWGLAVCALACPHRARAEGKAALAPTQIDHMIRAEWNKQGVVPAPAVDDARYFRRIYLDIVGVVPPLPLVKAYLADTNPNKRALAVEALLDSPQYADNWTQYWYAILMGRSRPNNAQVVDQSAFRQWLHGEFLQNAHWNKFVYDLISATGVNSTGGSYAKAAGLVSADTKMTPPMMQRGQFANRNAVNRNLANGAPANGGFTNRNAAAGGRAPGAAGTASNGPRMAAGDAMMAGDGMMADNVGIVKTANLPDPVNGATNWILKYQGNPQDLSGTASRVFLGVQIQCAQCHDHKTEKWKQEDFKKFTACFINARPRPVDPTMTQEQLKGKIRQVDLIEMPRPAIRRPALAKAKKPNNALDYINSMPTALDGTDLADTTNRRAALAAWMTAPSNPWFAKTIVNRMWNHFLGRGFIEPIDDIRPSNPVVMPELLDALSADFVAHDYDMKYLIKQICATQVYQLSAMPARKTDVDNKLWARFRLKPMGPEELMDSLVTATNMGPVLERVAGGRLDAIKFAMNKQFSFLFDVDEEFEQKDFEGTIPQALMLLNGNLVNRGATPIPGTALADVLNSGDSDMNKIISLYLRTLSRMPTQSELERWIEFVHAPRYMSTAPDAQAPQPQPQAQNAPANGAARRGRFANRNRGAFGNQAQTGPGNGVNAVPPPTPAERKALAQAMRKKQGNNGIDPLARLAPQAALASQSPEAQAYEDLFWALLNSSEFIFNH